MHRPKASSPDQPAERPKKGGVEDDLSSFHRDMYLNCIILQLYYDTVDSGFPSPFTYSINTTDEGYDEHRCTMEMSNVIGYNNSAELKTG